MLSTLRTDIKGYDELAELALDLRWSWNHYADKLWIKLDPSLWELTRNPWIILQTVSTDKLKDLLSESHFQKTIQDLLQTLRNQNAAPAWFQKQHPKSPLSTVAYFSMEFMLSEALPIYSGGLGNVAGDQLKAASDLGVPVIAVGLLYQKGYFRQIIDKDGQQQALYPYNDPGALPIVPLRKPNGEWVRIEIKFPGWPLWVRVWEVKVGRVKLYLLDSNDPANYPVHRGITSELYGGGVELRLKQELLLGICGWKLFEILGIKPNVCHLNEGHASFAILERARSFMADNKVSFEIALAATRTGNLFTTHTAVPAGFDCFPPALIGQYLSAYAQDSLKISFEDLMALGRVNPNDPAEPFNMAYLALRGSGAVNGVSRLHAKVSKHIFARLFPRWPEEQLPIGYVTNGVHVPSWDCAASDKLWSNVCGKNRWLGACEDLEKKIRSVPDVELWQMRNVQRRAMIENVRFRLARQLAASGSSAEDVENASHIFNPNILTLGFARRFATYKRPNMLLQDPERLLRLLLNPERPVQLIIAGKAHPADLSGQALIQRWIRFIRNSPARSHVIFVSDYDMLLTEQLVSGVDVWINTPRRPWEACGTSGMKVLVNGGLNLSELDGWWAEAYSPEVGWAIGDGQEHDSDPPWDAIEAASLYDLLENQVIPEFYQRDAHEIPTTWISRIRESMARLTPQYSANRAVREYTERHYLPAAAAYRQRTSDDAAVAKKIVVWQQHLQKCWKNVSFGEVKIETVGNSYFFEVQIHLDELKSSEVSVELYADGSSPFNMPMECANSVKDLSQMLIYTASVPADRPTTDYTPRVVPYNKETSVPLEVNQILWQSAS